MKKYFINITAIIFVNLFAFLTVWHILDAIFWSGVKFKLIFIFISIISLVFIMTFYLKKIIKELNNINNGKHKPRK